MTEEISGEIQRVVDEKMDQGQPGWYRTAAIIATSFGLSLAAVLLSVHAERNARQEADQKWCTIVTTLDDAYSEPGKQPTTPAGRNVAQAIRDLRAGLPCPSLVKGN